MKQDFFKELGRKSKEEVPKELDSLILGSFKAEQKSKLVFALVPALALSLVVIMNFRKDDDIQNHYELLRDYEVVTALEEIDPTELSEEEWDILLEGKDV